GSRSQSGGSRARMRWTFKVALFMGTRPAQSLGCSAREAVGSHRLLALDLGQMLQVHRPAERRAAPDLLYGRQLRALVQTADAQRVHRRIADRGGIDRRPAVRAEGLCALAAALRGLDVDPGRPREQAKRLLRCRNRDAKNGSRKPLAVGAMARGCARRIDFRFVTDFSAVTLAGDFHGEPP